MQHYLSGLFKDYFTMAISILVISLVSFSCEKKVADPVFTGESYFPVHSGAWIIYDVDSTVYDDFLGEVFHFQYQVMEIQKEFFTGESGDENMRLERFWRNNDQENWKIKNVWISGRNNNRALKTEENITFVKLAFPLTLDKTWNGNAFNHRAAQSYRVSDIHESRNYGNHTFDSTSRILQKEFITLIGEEFQYEVYAIGVGLVEKQYTDLQKEIDGTIKSGVSYNYAIWDYGESTPNN
jgi:hypothetical protein